jgi:hypothetical protein
LIVPKPRGSDAPDAVVVGVPSTGGEYDAHEPLHFDWVLVSAANQYKVSPPASSAVRQVIVDRGAVGRLYYTEDVDPQLKANLRARPAASHGLGARISNCLTRGTLGPPAWPR